MVTVGAGGGSIVWIDDGGMLRIGPQSAGAEPGPACYARGGTQPTLTDAHLLRGTLQADSLLGGAMQADIAAARRAFEPLARQLGLSAEQAADSAIRVAEAGIVRAIQQISTERGHDPRQYVLVPFGGAGPMLAARLAAALDIATVLVPANAGVLSAYGLLVADYVHYATLTRRLPADQASLAAIRATLQELVLAVTAKLQELGLQAAPQLSFIVEMRYVGQAFEIAVALPATDPQTLSLATLLDAFRSAHRRVFEFDKGEHGQCEVVSFRVGAAIAPPPLPPLSEPVAAMRTAVQQTLQIFENNVQKSCRRIPRHLFSTALTGPALIEDQTSTLYLPEHWQAQPDKHANLILTRSSV
jgi:N-methylhydantoinase A